MKSSTILCLTILVILQICAYLMADQNVTSPEHPRRFNRGKSRRYDSDFYTSSEISSEEDDRRQGRNQGQGQNGKGKKPYHGKHKHHRGGPHGPHGHHRHGPPPPPRANIDELINSIMTLQQAALSTVENAIAQMMQLLPPNSILRNLFMGIDFLLKNRNVLGALKTSLDTVNFGAAQLDRLNPVGLVGNLGRTGRAMAQNISQAARTGVENIGMSAADLTKDSLYHAGQIAAASTKMGMDMAQAPYQAFANPNAYNANPTTTPVDAYNQYDSGKKRKSNTYPEQVPRYY